jgi:hypothetical protein
VPSPRFNGQRAGILRATTADMMAARSRPASMTLGALPEPPNAKFQRLKEVWRAETEFQSSPRELTRNAHYLTIVGMGWPAVPILLRELRDDPDHWFAALTFITEAKPIEPHDAGNFQAMINAWLKWGRERGLV